MKFFKKNKRFYFFSPLVILLPLIIWGIYEYSLYTYPKLKVKKVIDGDTFEDAKGKIYRLFGIDTWETTTKLSDGTRKPTTGITYFYAQKAKLRLQELIEGKEINFFERGKDVYDRIVVSIFVDNQDVQKQLLKEGLAEVKYISSNLSSNFFTTDIAYKQDIWKIESIAKQNKLNIWSVK